MSPEKGRILRFAGVRSRTEAVSQFVVQHAAGIALIGLSLLIAAVAFAIFLEWQWISTVFWTWARQVPGGVESGSVTIRNLGLVVAGVVALTVALWRTWIAKTEADTARRDLVHQRYQRGAEMLSDDRVMVRLSGISALDRLAQEHPRIIHVEVVQLFCTYLRRFEAPDDHSADRYFSNMVEGKWFEDFATVMGALGTRNALQRALERKEELRLHLSDVNFGHGLHFPDSTDLSYATLVDSNLSQVTLTNADLSDTMAWGAKFGGASLRGSKFVRAKCHVSYFYNADLRDVDFSDAHLFSANLRSARVSGANFAGCRLDGADVSGTFFEAFLDSDTPAQGLTQQQLDKAEADPSEPPRLEHVADAVTGLPLVWRGPAST